MDDSSEYLAIPEITPEERIAGFNYTSLFYVGISGKEFLRRLDENLLDLTDDRVKKVLRRLWLVRSSSDRTPEM